MMKEKGWYILKEPVCVKSCASLDQNLHKDYCNENMLCSQANDMQENIV